jgi:antitoxin component YwqK of YwqJK toxin-antitoxin module
MNFTDYLEESKEGKNVHLEHIEDEVLNRGVAGTRDSINFLRSLRDMLAGHAESKVNVTTKWDGAPAVFCGINPENGKFFVGTKGVFAKNAKLNYTDKDIDNNHPAEGLNKKLKVALRYLPKLGIKGVLQGDMMFTKGDLKNEIIDGTDYITFQPNTIVYAVPVDSKLAQMMMAAQIGIVFHTSYTGKALEDMKASFNIDINNLTTTKDVWFRDASFVDASGTATFTEQETKQITNILSDIGNLFRGINPVVLNRIATTETIRTQIKTFNNSKVRAGQVIGDTFKHVRELTRFIEDKLNKEILSAKLDKTKQKRIAEKSELMRFYRNNATELKKIFDIQNGLVEAKSMVIKKLQQIRQVTGTFLKTDDGFKVTNAEGFVAVDKLKGNAVKLVDRLEFSQANFNAAKSWEK